MSRVTKFAARDPGPSARIVGFIAHLRENGLRLGVAEADLAMSALVEIDAIQPGDSRRALRAVCTGCKEEAERLLKEQAEAKVYACSRSTEHIL